MFANKSNYMELKMLIENLRLQNGNWKVDGDNLSAYDVNLVSVFGDTKEFANDVHFDFLKNKYPNAHIIGCSSAGNVLGSEISDSTMIATAVCFEKSNIVVEKVEFENGDNILQIAKELGEKFDTNGLKHIFLLADGLNLNGSELIRGFNLSVNVPVTGGLAGDNDRFETTFVMADDYAKQRVIVAIGFYGDSLQIGNGYYGGWSEFGTFRTITKSKENVLYELDGKPALDLYKEYLGAYADDLPNSGLRFPLSIKGEENSDTEVIRTLLAVDEVEKSITFAGDVPEGFTARLMKPNIDLLIDGAGQAAQIAKKESKNRGLGLVVSCVGRRIVMSQLVDEELEAVAEELGENVQLTG